MTEAYDPNAASDLDRGHGFPNATTPDLDRGQGFPTPAANPGQATPSSGSKSWQEEARAAGWQQPEDNSGFQQSSPQTQSMQTTPVDVGAGSSPMTVPLTPENRRGYTGDVNKDTGLPNELSLADVFSEIKLAPSQISSFLSGLASQHHGTPNQDLATKLNEHAVKISNPDTYKNDRNG